MAWLEILVGSLGGGAVVSAVLLKGLGGIVSSHVTESIKKEYATQLETVRHELEMLRGRTVRFDAAQFTLYGELWATLYDLQRAADTL